MAIICAGNGKDDTLIFELSAGPLETTKLSAKNGEIVLILGPDEPDRMLNKYNWWVRVLWRGGVYRMSGTDLKAVVDE